MRSVFTSNWHCRKYRWCRDPNLVSLPAMVDCSPQKSDPRPWFALLLGTYVTCGLAFFGFGRTPWQIALVVSTAVAADSRWHLP